jgi:predicted regulator of Ras-like GTPase activity (Roadblock/LC7/MglB family)
VNKQEQLSRILEDLREAVPDVYGAMVASFDGLPVASSLGEVEPSRVAAMTATVRALGVRVVETMGAGAFQEVVIRSESGMFVVYDAGDLAALAVVTRPGANLGLVHLEARHAARAVEDLLAEARREVGEVGDVVEPMTAPAAPVYEHAEPVWSADVTYEPAHL